MEIERLHALATDIFKAINIIQPSFMKDIFTPKRDPKIRPIDILVKHHKPSKYGEKRLIALGLKIWNQLNFLPM